MSLVRGNDSLLSIAKDLWIPILTRSDNARANTRLHLRFPRM